MTIPGADLSVTFREGETIWTESSHKFTRSDLEATRARRVLLRRLSGWIANGPSPRACGSLPDAGTAGIVSRRFFSIDQRQILDGLSFDVYPGETLVLLGRSGSGKTTALKMVNALVLPTRGEVLWKASHRSVGSDSFAPPHRLRDSGDRLFPAFLDFRNVGLVPSLERWPPEKLDARVNTLLEKWASIPPSTRGRFPSELSGGQRQRVGVARALAADP